ncbi:MAG TPA: BamA/TamA family outer membrane protein [Longimicrobiales bacterium]|nr:BamA/TamA family outer membrane protein [Longimicrobiales bacterium]
MRSPSPLLRATATALSLLSVISAGPLQGQARPEVASVGFQGNRAFPSDSLAWAIVTRGTECRSVVFAPFCWAGAEFAIRRAYLPRTEFPLDQLRLQVWYQRRGYREASIDTATVVGADGRVGVTFTINEGRPVLVDSIAYVGVEDLVTPDLFRNLPLKVGDPLSAIAADATRDTLSNRLANLGYARVEVLRSFFIPNADPYAAQMTYDIAPGPRSRYGHVSVAGNANLSESTVLRTLQFRGGDVYRLGQIRDAQARLFGLEIIRSATVVPDFQSGPDSVIPVNVTVVEGDPHRVRSGAGWSTSECLNVESRWVSRNFMGGGRRVQVRGRVANILARDFQDLLCPQSGKGVFASLNWLASVDFAQPWVFSTRNAFQASLYAERQSVPEAFVRKAVGLSFALTRSIGPRTPLTLAYRPDLSRLEAAELLFCTSFLVCTPGDIAILQGANWLAPVGLNFTRDATNNLLNASRGYSMVLDLEHAEPWTGSDFAYTRLQGEFARYAQVTSQTVLAGRVRAGWVHAGAFGQLLSNRPSVDIVHPQKRFFAGGANSVRGYAQGRLGPQVLFARLPSLLDVEGVACTPESILDLSCDATALGDSGFQSRPIGGTRVLEGNLEARFSLGSAFQGAVFTDVGQVWGDQAPVSLSSLRVTPGFGVRYLSPIGPLRVDVAYRTSGGEALSVVTNQLRPFEVGVDSKADPTCLGADCAFLQTQALAILRPRVLFNESSAASLRRWQLHISIGQAF